MNEHLIGQPAPHVRQSETVETIMADMIIAMIPFYIMAFFFYGERTVALGILSAAVCVICTLLCNLLLKKKPDMADLSPIVTGLIIPLMLPADIPYSIVATAAAVAILIVKFPFGGTGENVFNPAAVGFAFAALCWPDKVFSYPSVFTKLSVFGENIAKSSLSPSHYLSAGIVPDYDILDMFLGNTPGPMGMTSAVVIIACGIFIIARKGASPRIPFFFISVYALLNMLFPRITTTALESAGYELCSGMIMFGAFFMLTEPVTGPKRDTAKSIYGGLSAVIVFLFHRFGKFEDGFVFALIIMNVFAPYIDMVCENTMHAIRNGNRNTVYDKLKIKNVFSSLNRKGDEKA